MPELVVDRLEVVQVAEQHDRRDTAPGRARQRVREPVHQQVAVRQPGQRVVQRTVREALPGRPGDGDVLHLGDVVRRLVVLVAGHRDREGHPDDLAVPVVGSASPACSGRCAPPVSSSRSSRSEPRSSAWVSSWKVRPTSSASSYPSSRHSAWFTSVNAPSSPTSAMPTGACAIAERNCSSLRASARDAARWAVTSLNVVTTPTTADEPSGCVSNSGSAAHLEPDQRPVGAVHTQGHVADRDAASPEPPRPAARRPGSRTRPRARRASAGRPSGRPASARARGPAPGRPRRWR